jgi:hypothetical protein
MVLNDIEDLYMTEIGVEPFAEMTFKMPIIKK